MECFDTFAIESAIKKPKMCLRYVDITCIIWNGNDEELQNFLSHLNNISPSIKLTMEKEVENKLSFLDVLVERDGRRTGTSVYRKVM